MRILKRRERKLKHEKFVKSKKKEDYSKTGKLCI